MEEKIDLIVAGPESGTRLDAFLARHLALSRSHASRLVEGGCVQVDGGAKRSAFRLRTGMQVQGAWRREGERRTIEAKEMPLDVLYEDSWIAVINKRAGMTVHPGAGAAGTTLVNALLARYPDIDGVGDPDRPGIVHRLDKLTSGVMVVARTAEAHRVLSTAFKAHGHTREYLAVCYGHMPQKTGTIETFMERNPKDRKRMTSRTGEGRRAVTRWEVLDEWKEFSLLRLSLETGRTHQIRVHLSDMGHPVAGDPVYGGRRRANTVADTRTRAYVKGLGRQMLHAALLGIRHPGTGEYMEFNCNMPKDMQVLIELFDEMEKSA